MKITYVGKKNKLDIENGFCNIGTLVTINTEWIITECDASIEHQETIYKYGNVLTTSIQESTLGREHTLIKRPAKFRKEAYKEYKRYQTYNK